MSTPENAKAAAPQSARRSRRKTTKAIDYSKEQEFSDDAFEDNIGGERPPSPTAPSSSRRGRPRASNRRKTVDEDGVVMEYDAAGFQGGKPRYVEKGYDPSLPPIRERYTFAPEYEPDGSPKIEAIIGRRPLEDKEGDGKALQEGDSADEEETSQGASDDDDSGDESDDSSKKPSPRRKKKKKRPTKKSKKGSQSAARSVLPKHVEYEYLVKFKGKSYLHLEWKTASDLESLNKSAKTLYRRFLKKLEAGTDENLEDPNFDPSYAEPGRILDEKEEEVFVDLSDKEFLAWMKEREKELAMEDDEEKEVHGEQAEVKKDEDKKDESDEAKKENGDRAEAEEEEKKALEEGEESGVAEEGLPVIERIRKLVFKDEPYYPTYEGSDNPYRDGYVTEPPKKPRASYLFFQGAHRAEYQKRYAGASQGEIMTILGDTWRTMSEEEQAPYIQLAKEEAEKYDKERAMMERAQKPNEMWQPLRRCRMVLDRIWADSFSNIFHEPVSLTDFPDYEETVDQPMDLGTIKTKLIKRKYQAPEIFARDMRKVWHNCKVYNLHGSAIWHLADYMSKMFERLYQAWVLAFRNRYLRWANPRARPWELSCRIHDGKCGTADEKMVMCDHCDATYGMSCLTPPLKQLPNGIWHCPDCCSVIGQHDRVRMLSSLSEQAARKRAELGDVPKKKVKRKMLLVKWAGLGYENCTWEPQELINDDAIVAEYRILNNMSPDEPDVAQSDVDKILKKAVHLTADAPQVQSCVPELRSQLYAQTRAFHFVRFGLRIPCLLRKYCGPTCDALSSFAVSGGVETEQLSSDVVTGALLPSFSKNSEEKKEYPEEVVECVSSLVSKVVQGFESADLSLPSMPPLLTGEYDAVIPITSKGLMMNVGDVHGSVAFLGYRQFPDGSKGPTEIKNLVRKAGDKIIAVDAVSTLDKSFKEVICMLRESGKNTFAYMRFLDHKLGMCEPHLTSMGKTGATLCADLSKKFKENRRRVLSQRGQSENSDGDEEQEQEQEDESDESVGTRGSEDDDSSTSSSDDEFEPVRVDELKTEQDTNENQAPESSSPQDSKETPKAQAPQGVTSSNVEQVASTPGTEKGTSHHLNGTHNSGDEELPTVTPSTPIKQVVEVPKKKETTKSLALRLLDVDVGYSSDEGGDESRAFFFDGVDSTFSTEKQTKLMLEKSRTLSEEDDEASEQQTESVSSKLPVKKTELNTLGERSALMAAVTVSQCEPLTSDFDNYPLESTAMIAQRKAEEEKKRAEEEAEEAKRELAESVVVKKSTTKVEQVSTTSNEVIHVWKTAADAAATLQISLKEIQQILKGDYNEEIGDEAGGYRWRYADEDAEVTAKVNKGGSQKGKQALLEFRDKLYDHDDPHMYKGGHKLRDYQVDGVNWLASCWYKRHSCILADEMGLGKTVQIVTYIEHLYRVEKISKPYLVVVPLSTVEHWRREFEGWTDMICCVYHDRQREWRDVMREYEWYYPDRPHTPEFLKFDVLVTTYDTLIADFDVIGSIAWRVAVVDEAHRLRNVKGKLLECMKQISQRGTLQYGYQSRVLMTGTPLQNNTQELWTLLNFIEPYKFPSLDDFQANFGNMANREQVEALQQKISPFMLRRVKEDVAKDIPAKEETLIDVELTSIQKQYYRAIFEHNHTFLSMGTTRATAPKLMNIQMELRKCCNHPFLLDGVEQRELEKQQNDFLKSGELNGLPAEEQSRRVHEEGYIKSSGKMVLLDKLLPKLRQEGHKVLIFSQMVRMLDLISEFCDFRGFRHERLDGRVRGNERQKAIDRFETEEDSFVFLLSTRAGGVGINLTAADICIIFDSDWNPQNDVQAQARCHRIGQTKDVMIYRLVTSRTFEQEMFDRASKKLGLEQAVLGTFGQEGDDAKPTTQEMEQLLKKGAYALMEDENDEIGKEFCEDDIESILAKRTRTRVVEGAKTSSWLNKQGLVVSKSKFTAEGAEASAGVDLDDPNFWQKVMPDFVTPAIMLSNLEELSELADKRAAGKAAGDNRGSRKRKLSKGKGSAETEGGENDNRHSGSGGLTRGDQKKINKFMADLSGLMAEIFDQDEDDNLPQSEKSTCQKLLLQITLKNKLFSDDQRNTAKVMLRKLEGSRRRRCRTNEQGGGRFSSRLDDDDVATPTVIPEQLRIRSTKKKRRKRGRGKEKDEEEPDIEVEVDADDEDEKDEKEPSSEAGGYVGEDGYLHHSDSEADWSDVGEDPYQLNRKRGGISEKEAKRRRAWACDKDPTKAAGRPWPSFPRSKLSQVLKSVLDDVIKIDKSKGGLFSVPVPRNEFPEYYEVVKQPMDYGTMKKKLMRGEYRSAQAMQKDFLLIMQNCVTFNAPDSDIVKEARRQALSMPNLLKTAALANKLFLCEDGSVLEVHSENEDQSESTKGKGKKKKKSQRDLSRKRKAVGSPKRSKSPDTSDEESSDEEAGRKRTSSRRQASKKSERSGGSDASETESEDEASDADPGERAPKKPRIRISLNNSSRRENGVAERESKRKKKKPKKEEKEKPQDSADEEETPVASAASTIKRRRTKGGKAATSVPNVDPPPRRKRRRGVSDSVVAESDEKDSNSTKDEEEPKKKKKESTSSGSTFSIPRKRSAGDATGEKGDPGAVHMTRSLFKKRANALDGSFHSARKFFTERGPWSLPNVVGEDKYKDVALHTLNKMCRNDRYSLFATAVTEDEAPGYFKTVKHPMDFGTMRKKLENDEYGTGSDAVGALYEDFLLVIDNCSLYNDEDSEVCVEAARLASLLPETFASACMAVSGVQEGKNKKKRG